MAQETCSSSSPSSSNQKRFYDVFGSFRGRDTRYKFTDHLFAALDRSGIHSFKDNRKIRRGKHIWPELEKAIQESRIAVIVFSENYADSRWCLEELAKIMECKRNLQQIVLPIFYEVDPSHIRNQKGSLEKAFVRHVGRFEVDVVERWRAALNEAGNLAGWDSQDVAYRFESIFLGKIIEDISGKLNGLAPLTVAPYPVGIESRVQQLDELLSKHSSDVCMVGIWGIGGIGKTTIARAIYNQLQKKFEASCFLENVGEIAKQSQGLGCLQLQNQILSSFHVIDDSRVELIALGTEEIKTRAWHNKVLVVLDNVDHQDQLDQLAIRRGNFQPGSIIIITTRDKSMFNLDEINEIYKPPTLDYHESIKLLSWHAFRNDQPKDNYVELSKEVIFYAGGLPLTLKVLGSSLSNKSTTEWKGTLEKLRLIPNEEIQKKIVVCVHSLSDLQKELFLDIACFFVGIEKNYFFKILSQSNLILESDLGVLVHQSLVTIDCSNHLTMHDSIRDMGREVVRNESPKFPGRRSRLFLYEDVLDALQCDHMETESIEGIMLSKAQNLLVESKAFVNMRRLRVLQLNYAQIRGNFLCLPRRLRYLEWYGFPLESIPLDLHMENLVAIYMPHSWLTELWTGTKILRSLKFLDFSYSSNLTRTPDFSEIINLEVLVLRNCKSLVEVHKSVIRLDKLVTFDLSDCKNLELPQEIDEFMKRVNNRETGLEPKSPSIIRHILPVKLQDCICRVLRNQRCSESAAAHHPSQPQPLLKEKATFVVVDVYVLNTTTFKSELEALALWKLHMRVVRQFKKIKEFRGRHRLMTGTPLPLPRLQLTLGERVQDLTIQRSFQILFLTLSTASIARFHLSVVINFIDGLKLESSSCRTLLIAQLSKGLEAMDENIATFLKWIFPNCSELSKKSPAKLFKELMATISISCFLSLGEFPEWFDNISTGSILYFVVPPNIPPQLKQEIQGWLLCVEFATRFHDICGSDIIYTFKNKTKGIEWQYGKKDCSVQRSQEHIWLHSVPLHGIVHMLEARDVVEYSIQVSGSFQLKKFGVKLIYWNDVECCQSKFEAMIQNVPLPHTDDFHDAVDSISSTIGW